MKFYYLPFPLGFISFSKNHFSIYNEKQEAKSLVLVNNSNNIHNDIYCWRLQYQPIRKMQKHINEYQHYKNTTFEEHLESGEEWIIK